MATNLDGGVSDDNAPLLSGYVKVRRTDAMLGSSFDRRYLSLFANRLDFWKTEEVRSFSSLWLVFVSVRGYWGLALASPCLVVSS